MCDLISSSIIESNPLQDGFLCSLDDRYKRRLDESGLTKWCGERNFTYLRAKIAVEYLKFISDVKKVDIQKDFEFDKLFEYIKTDEYFMDVKEREKQTKHDISAIVDIIQNKMKSMGCETKFINMVHYGLTSQDLNTTANLIMIQKQLTILKLSFNDLIKKLGDDAEGKYSSFSMVTYTHGQPAVPGRLKNLFLTHRNTLQFHLDNFEKIDFYTKFGGAIGELNAHKFIDPDINWEQKMDEFIESLEYGFKRAPKTKQVLPYSYWLPFWDFIRNMLLTLNSLCIDMWLLTFKNYFLQKIIGNGSSTMPQKVNPIELEQCKGFIAKSISSIQPLQDIATSFLHRDLSDTGILRDVGVCTGNAYLGVSSMLKYLEKIDVNIRIISKDLHENPLIVSEGLNTILRNDGIENPYYEIKKLTQGLVIHSKAEFDELKKRVIDKFELSEKAIELINNLSILTYRGY